MEFWTLDGLERSGRPVGIISTYFRQKRSGGFRAMIILLCKNFGFKNSRLTLEICLLAGIGRSVVMIGSLCLDMVPKFPQGSEL